MSGIASYDEDTGVASAFAVGKIVRTFGYCVGSSMEVSEEGRMEKFAHGRSKVRDRVAEGGVWKKIKNGGRLHGKDEGYASSNTTGE